MTPNARKQARGADDGSHGKVWLAVGGFVIVGLVVLALMVPRYVKQRCIDTAAAEGVILTIASVQMSWGQVHLSDVTFKIEGVPQLNGEASDVDVTLSGLTPQTVAGRGVGITIDGSSEELSAAIDKWRAAHAKAPGRAAAAAAAEQKVTMQSGHIAWTRAFGQIGTIDASEVTADTDGNGAAFHLTSEKTLVGTPKGSLGPWRVTFERDAQSERARVDLDPPVHDGPSALYVKTPSGALSIKVAIPKSPLPRIGFPPALLGLSAGQATLMEASIDFERTSTSHVDMKNDVALYGARLGMAPIPVDVRLEFSAAGDAAKPLDVTHGALTVGPFHASVAGTMQTFPDGARLSLAWRTQPLKCEAMAQNAAKGALGDLGDIANSLGNFAKSLGVAKVTGEAHASGLLTIDTRNLNDVSFTMTANDTCGIAIFGQ